MNRHEFAPSIILPEAEDFLALPENEPYFANFLPFYQHYCTASLDHPVIRNDQEFSTVVSTHITRTEIDRIILALRSASRDDGDITYRLFTRSFKNPTITEYEITKSAYTLVSTFIPVHSMFFLAVDPDGNETVLELGGDMHQQSIWTTAGNEYLLEPLPLIPLIS